MDGIKEYFPGVVHIAYHIGSTFVLVPPFNFSKRIVIQMDDPSQLILSFLDMVNRIGYNG
jgi:hypothetical protein